MAARANARLDQGGALAAGGTANALTVTTNQILTPGTHLAAGLRLALRATATNTTAAVTLAVDGSSPLSIRRADGSALAIGSIASGMMLDLFYNAGSSQWRAANIASLQPIASVIFPVPTTPTPPTTGAALASFSISKGAPQTVSITSSTVITFAAGVDFDIGSHYSPNTWTPPAGTALVGINAQIINNSGVAATFGISLTKGATIIAQNVSAGTIANGQACTLSIMSVAQVSGAQSLFVSTFSSAQPYNVAAGVQTTFFGSMI